MPHRPKPPPPHHHHGPHHGPVPVSAVDASLARDAVDRILQPFLPDSGDRGFVVRCIVEEGPVHHRGASYALIRMLGAALDAAGGAPPPRPDAPTAPVSMRLPPHLRRHGDDAEQAFPLALPLAPLERLAAPGSRELGALVDCLTDGPPHHALANAAMVTLLGALLERLDARPA